MKKNIFAVVVFLLVVGTVEAKENYLQLRHEAGENNKTHKSFSTFRLLAENFSENWISGFKLITKEKAYMFFNPYVLYKINKKTGFGFRYSHDSLGYKALGPIVRYTEKMGDFFSVIEYAYDFDLENDKNFSDLYWSILYKKNNWAIGSELGYYFYKQEAQNLKIRPIKITYTFQNFSPFLILQRRWNNEGLIADSVLGGVGIKF